MVAGALCFFFSSRRRHTRCGRDWSSDVCSSDLHVRVVGERLVDPLVDQGGHDVEVGRVPVDPAEGGWGSYSMISWAFLASCLLVSSAARWSAMSMPAETPAEQRNLPSCTHRCRCYWAPSRLSWSARAQCVVALRPSSSPAAAKIRDPVHTEATVSSTET